MSQVLFEIRDNAALITLNNPDKRNMLTLEVCAEIVRYVKEAEEHPEVKALIVTGSGRAFCAGGQLSDLIPDQEILESIYSGFLSIANCKLPTIAAVNGAAVGAGFNMAVGCDVRIVTEKARFEPRFFGLGLHPGGGNTWMLRQLVNWNTAAGMLLFSQSLSGREAVEKGLAWKCVAMRIWLQRPLNLPPIFATCRKSCCCAPNRLCAQQGARIVTRRCWRLKPRRRFGRSTNPTPGTLLPR